MDRPHKSESEPFPSQRRLHISSLRFLERLRFSFSLSISQQAPIIEKIEALTEWRCEFSTASDSIGKVESSLNPGSLMGNRFEHFLISPCICFCFDKFHKTDRIVNDKWPANFAGRGLLTVAINPLWNVYYFTTRFYHHRGNEEFPPRKRISHRNRRSKHPMSPFFFVPIHHVLHCHHVKKTDIERKKTLHWSGFKKIFSPDRKSSVWNECQWQPPLIRWANMLREKKRKKAHSTSIAKVNTKIQHSKTGNNQPVHSYYFQLIRHYGLVNRFPIRIKQNRRRYEFNQQERRPGTNHERGRPVPVVDGSK